MHPDKESGLDLFCCHASDRLTDHLPHGEGLLCFEWLRSLGENGAGVYAYSPHPALAGEYPWLDLYVSQARIRFPSFAHHVYNREAQEIYRRLAPRLHAPWVWRQYPYVEAFPAFDTFGAPLAIGPLYSWFVERPLRGERRFGLRPHHLATNSGRRGWLRNLARARLLFTESRPLERKLREDYPDKHIVTLPPVIEPPPLPPRPPAPDRPVRLVFVANLLPEKRVLDFCRVVQALQAEGFDVEGSIIGDGPERQAAETLCASFEPRPRIHFHGQMPNAAVWAELATCDFFIALRPEVLGRAIMEAMAVGVVCLCRNEFGPLDYIRDGENGFLIGESDWRSYVAKLRELIPRTGLRNHVSAQAIESAQAWRRPKVARLLLEAFAAARPDRREFEKLS